MNLVVAVFALICVLFAITWLLRQRAAARWQMFSQVLLVGGIAVLLLAILSGRLPPLIAAIGGGLALLSRLLTAKRIFDCFKPTARPSGGASSKVSTRFVDMFLDHDSGDMSGTVREGRFSGRELSQLSIDELLLLLAQCRSNDAQSATVLEAYLERTHREAWRERDAAGADPHQSYSAQHDLTMSDEEARDVLGVSAHAGHDEIIAAHRQLMQKIHPDRGGSTYLAAKVNQAKEVLSKRSSSRE